MNDLIIPFFVIVFIALMTWPLLFKWSKRNLIAWAILTALILIWSCYELYVMIYGEIPRRPDEGIARSFAFLFKSALVFAYFLSSIARLIAHAIGDDRR